MKTLARPPGRHEHAPGDKKEHGPPRHAEPSGVPLQGLDNLGLQALFASGALRARLHAGAPGDPAESEADQMADAALAGKPAGCHCAPGKPPCSACQAATIRRKPRGTGNRAAPPVPPDLALGPERRLGPAERDFFESRYGADLSGVRIHDNDQAADSAGRLDARAFAVGDRIAFGRGEYRPDTGAGRRLLGHELAHVVRGHTGIRRNGGPPAPAPTPDPKQGEDFDPCALDVKTLDNKALLAHFALAQKYIASLLAAKRKGEDRFYDYGNLLDRLATERSARARAGHVWLKAGVTDVPGHLWRLEAATFGNAVSVTPADLKGAAANAPVGAALVLTDGQFSDFRAKEKIPDVDPQAFFEAQDPNKPVQPMNLPVAEREPPKQLDPYNLFGLHDKDAAPGPASASRLSGLGPWGTNAAAPLSDTSSFVFRTFAKPVVTAGPLGYDAAGREGLASDWRGDLGEARFLAKDPESLKAQVDMNRWHANFDLFDVYDPRSEALISVKTQLPTVAGDDPSLVVVQQAFRELFGAGDPAKRARALGRLQTHISSTMTQDQMLLNARVAVNPENVPAAQDSLANAIRNKQDYYEPLLSALMRQQPVSVKLKDGSTKAYIDFASLQADFKATPRLMTEQRYRDAVGELAQRARSQVISNDSAGEAELRPRLNNRQRYDFAGASDFSGVTDTPASKQAARALQQEYYEKIGSPELYEFQTKGYGPTLKSAAKTGGGLAAGTTAVLGSRDLYNNWGKDPYALQRYAANVGLSGVGGSAQAVTDQALRASISQGGLDWAASRAAAGKSVAPLTKAVPAARFGGSTLLGGVASGGITLGSMYLDESYFGADYSTIDYTAKTTRAFVVGSASAGIGAAGGALATALATAAVGGGSGAVGCTFVLPGVGTVACGTVGAVGGFIVGLGSYYVIDWAVGDEIEAGVRESMGEGGCKGKAAPAASKPATRESSILSCFAAATPVLLADGSTRPIAMLATGDMVLAWHERENRLQACPVTAVHAMPAAAMLELALGGGAWVRVTATHKLRTPDGWTPAGELRPGDSLYSADVSGGALSATTVRGVRPVPADGSVYDLSVATTHTYFAGGILAHNKL